MSLGYLCPRISVCCIEFSKPFIHESYISVTLMSVLLHFFKQLHQFPCLEVYEISKIYIWGPTSSIFGVLDCFNIMNMITIVFRIIK